MRELTCPACAAPAPSITPGGLLIFRSSLQLSHYRCAECSHRWIETSPEQQEVIEKLYDRGYAGYATDEYFRLNIEREIRQKLSAVVSPPSSILDVGCGNCDFVEIAATAGYEAVGIDVSETAAQLGRARGLRVEAGDFRSHDFTRCFDVISFWDVLEHLREPYVFLQRTRELLGANGFVWIKVPSFGELNFRLLRACPTRAPLLLDAPGHIQFYTQTSLSRMLRRAGFHRFTWFESQGFRRRPPSRSPRKLLGRALRDGIGRLAGNGTFYLFAHGSGIETQTEPAVCRPKQSKTLVD